MSLFMRWRRWALVAALFPALAPALAAPTPSTEAPAPVNSPLDAPLFYQLLIGELELAGGQPSTAYEVILDAARRTRDPNLFRRAIEIAIQGRAGEQALFAVRAWRLAQPESLDAVRSEVQILGALNRLAEASEPLRALMRLTPAAERPGLIAALPRAVPRATDRKKAAQALEDVLSPYLREPALFVPVKVALGRAWLAAGESERALALAREAQQQEAAAPGPALLALELMPHKAEAEALVLSYLRTAAPEVPVRLAYVRALTGAQRLLDAIAQLEIVSRAQPTLAAPFLTLGALQLEMRHFAEAEAALRRYLDLAQAAPAAASSASSSSAAASAAASAPASPADDDADDDEDTGKRADQGVVEAWLLLARAAEQRGDFAAAEAWLARIDEPRRALDVQTRRATILARQGRVAEAREAIRRVPERNTEDARAKFVAEAAVLRETKRWADAYSVLGSAATRFPDDADLLYEQAMMAEKLSRMDDAERLLRRVIEIKPDNAHAHNALGYSLADRGVRLTEARQLIARALELSPGDPFITDSLGWVEYRLGNLDESIRLLRRAWAARPDAEIGAHLGEALWAAGQRDEARRIWRDARSRDEGNEALRETLARLKVDL